MLRISSRIFCVGVALAALLLFANNNAFGQSTTGQSQASPAQTSSGTSSGQSLGDIARANQEKKAAEGTASRMITNADLPKHTDEDAAEPANEDQNSARPDRAKAAASRKVAQQNAAQERLAAQWQQQILAQKARVSTLQARCDRLRAQIHFANPGYPYSSDNAAGSNYNWQEARMTERLREIQDQLNQQRQRLEQMQEAARHAGLHTTVYDP